MQNILLTGATGCVGKRLLEALLKEQIFRVRLFVRDITRLDKKLRDSLDIVQGDTFNKKALDEALEGIDIAYYLIHSWDQGKNFKELDKLSAENFREACVKAKVKKIIYLGGLGNRKTAGEHLLSRMETGKTLSAERGHIRTIWFRAGIVVGAGASFQILRGTVRKFPILPLPKWTNTKTQPIAIEDTISYLKAAASFDTKENIIVDIGAEAMTFEEMIKKTAKEMKLSRLTVPVPCIKPDMAGHLFALTSPVSHKMALALADSLTSETIVQNNNAAKYFPQIKPMSFEQALRASL